MTVENLRRAISTAYLADENMVAAELLERARLAPAQAKAVRALAKELVIRTRQKPSGNGIDALLQEYELSTEEGVVLMCLAESLLRVPDAETADKLIRDKLGHGRWEEHLGKSRSLFVNASTFALMLTGRIMKLDEAARWDFEGIFRKLVGRAGEPVIRQAVTYAMRILGRQFVLGRTIEEAIERTESHYRYSFDMLGEAAYTRKDAERYMAAYKNALGSIAKRFPSEPEASIFTRPSISVKLSALHPRYEYAKRERVQKELLPALISLAADAKAANLGLTVDAEEAERLDIMLDLFEALCMSPKLQGWNGLGLAVQAYQKRALGVLSFVAELAKTSSRRIPVRLVKGAYWDSEIKRAQESGITDYPVFTRKAGTDVSYIACAKAIFAAADALYPQFATHNAHTLATIETLAGDRNDYELQRLHGMGESLYDVFSECRNPASRGIGTRIYAPVGSHEDLLAYLVRRLLENGANTSFVNRLADEETPVEEIIADPVTVLAEATPRRNPRIPLPVNLLPDRRNSQGFYWSDPAIAGRVLAEMERSLASVQPAIASGGGALGSRPIYDPSDRRRKVGEVAEAGSDHAMAALERAHTAARLWDSMGGTERAAILERAADLYEQNRASLMALAVREAGKTLPAALSEVREAADFLRYYAKCAREQFAGDRILPGPTGEENRLSLHGRGVFACIAPWNFPLAIFTGQVAGALAAGNAVLAKPAEQTPLIAAAGVALLHRGGVPEEVLQFLPGDGPTIGNAIFTDARLSGVAFTGSSETAMAINRSLASRSGPVATLIAETGGQNAMVVDSTALPEQVARDVIASAFDSAGQRCSALRVLFLQEDVADKMLDYILGAMDELSIGDPMKLETDIGPVIDEDARETLERHSLRMSHEAKLLRQLPLGPEHEHGVFFAPRAFEIERMSQITREVFGPVLHVIRYAADRLEAVCDAINATGYGLTLGLHSRIDETADFLRARVRVGNFYVNRNQIGAVVGVQPFGGEGLSGTGPKAGGPHYLTRFAVERTFTVNTAAAGGNAALLASDT